MKKLIALLIVTVFIAVGCGPDVPSTHLVKQSVIKILQASQPDVLKKVEVVDFKRTNGQAINILGQAAYRVDGLVVSRRLVPGINKKTRAVLNVGDEYEVETSIVFVKTEQGWEPRMINGMRIPWELYDNK